MDSTDSSAARPVTALDEGAAGDGAPGAIPSGIDLVEEPDRSVLQMWGEVDSALRPSASGALARALDRNLPVVIDTSRVDFIDSTGIAFLVQVCTIGRDEGLDVRLVDPPAVVSDVLEMLGVDDLLNQRQPRG